MLKRKTRLAALLLLTGALTIGTYAGSASSTAAAIPSQDVETKATQTYKNEAYGGCLWALGDRPITGTCGVANDELDWHVTRWGDGTVRLKNVGTGECLSNKERTMQMDSCDTSKVQSWYVDRWNDGTIRFRDQRYNECIEGSEPGTVVTGPCDTSEAQSWY